MRDSLFPRLRNSDLRCPKCKKFLLDCFCINLTDNREDLSKEMSVKKLSPEATEGLRKRIGSLRSTLEEVEKLLSANPKKPVVRKGKGSRKL